MGYFRFRKTLRLGRFLRINLSKTGASTSIGSHGATVNIGRKGVFGTIGWPGSGLSYRQKLRSASTTVLKGLMVLAFIVLLVLVTIVSEAAVHSWLVY